MSSAKEGNRTAAVLYPMVCEGELLLSALEEKKEKRIGGFLFHEGRIGSLTVITARCLIGNVNAALCAAYAIGQYAPDFLILQGTAGAHDPAYRRNDLVLAEKTVSLTHTVSPKRGAGEGSDPFSWESFGIQTFSREKGDTDHTDAFYGDRMLLSLAREVPYPFGKVIVGTVGCGDVWNRETDLILHYRKTMGTDCEAMEGIGTAQVCTAYGVPMLEIRVISNNELCPGEVFSRDTAENCQRFVLALLKAAGR